MSIKLGLKQYPDDLTENTEVHVRFEYSCNEAKQNTYVDTIVL